MSGMHVAQRRLIVDAARGFVSGSFSDFESSLDAETERRRGLLRVASEPTDAKAEELPELRGIAAGRLEEAGWEEWLRAFFSSYLSKPFAPHHRQLWEWAWSVKPNVRPRPFVMILSRGGGKSQSGELASASFLARGVRRYGVYVCLTQDQADDRVANIARLLETPLISAYYPESTSRGVSKYGSPKAWRRDRLVTANGSVLDALGLDVAGARGLKEGSLRPDFFVLDELDGLHDSKTITDKKVKILTRTILPLGAGGKTAVLAIQNLMIPDGIFARLHKKQARFLADRIVVGPIPAVRNLVTRSVESPDGSLRDVIVSGEPTWEGQTLADCQAEIDGADLSSFLCEFQHEVEAPEGALWKSDDIRHLANVPTSFRRIVVGVDPTGGTAEAGVVAAGVVGSGSEARYYVLDDSSQPGYKGPEAWAAASGEVYRRRQANAIVAERNFGGDMVKSTLRDHAGSPVHVVVTTSARGKDVRAEPVVADYQAGKVFHCGTFPELEREMTYWVPGHGKSPNRVDALVFALNELREPSKRAMSWTASRPPGY